MGFKVKARVYVLDFEGTHYEGLEIRAKSISMEKFEHLAKLKEISGEEIGDALADLYSEFIGAVVSWNLEDENDAPIPVTIEAFRALEADAPGITLDVIKAWMTAIAGVSAPLGEGSSNGAKSVEASIPMEILSSDRAS